MTRRIQIQTSNSIGTWIAKNNQLSDNFGDLDLLDSAFESNRYGKADSNFVSALNFLHRKIDSAARAIFDSGGILNVSTLIADSAVINRIRANFLYAESADIDSAFTHILRGHQLDYTTAHIESAEIAFLTGKTIEYDSARIKYLSGNFIDFDSAKFGNLTATDSAIFTNATVQNLTLNNKLGFGGQEFSHVFPFSIKDSAGTVLLGGYVLSTDSDIRVP